MKSRKKRHKWTTMPGHRFDVQHWHQVCRACGWHLRYSLGSRGGYVAEYERGEEIVLRDPPPCKPVTP